MFPQPKAKRTLQEQTTRFDHSILKAAAELIFLFSVTSRESRAHLNSPCPLLRDYIRFLSGGWQLPAVITSWFVWCLVSVVGCLELNNVFVPLFAGNQEVPCACNAPITEGQGQREVAQAWMLGTRCPWSALSLAGKGHQPMTLTPFSECQAAPVHHHEECWEAEQKGFFLVTSALWATKENQRLTESVCEDRWGAPRGCIPANAWARSCWDLAQWKALQGSPGYLSHIKSSCPTAVGNMRTWQSCRELKDRAGCGAQKSGEQHGWYDCVKRFSSSLWSLHLRGSIVMQIPTRLSSGHDGGCCLCCISRATLQQSRVLCTQMSFSCTHVQALYLQI